MAQVTEVTATYSRKVQPRDYESASADLTFRAMIADGEDGAAVAQSLLQQARGLVESELGMQKTSYGPVVVQNSATVQVSKEMEKVSLKKAEEEATPEQKEQVEKFLTGSKEEVKQPATQSVSQENAQLTIAKLITDRKVTTQEVKDTLTQYGVVRIGDLTDGQRGELIERLRKVASKASTNGEIPA